MLPRRTPTWLGFGALVTTLGACQLVSGLSGYRESGSGTGGAAASSSTTASTGGATASSGTGGAATSAASSSGAGGAGGCSPGESFCSNSCHMDDPKNCGWCEHACEGTPCTNQMCQPVAVTATSATITAITASPTLSGVYWADGATTSSLHGVNKLAVPVNAVPFSYEVSALALSTGADLVFYTGPSGYYQWDLAAGTGMTIQPIPSLMKLGSLAVAESTHVAWAGKVGATWTIFHTMTGGGSYVTLPSDGPQVTADSVNIYWISGHGFFKMNSATPMGGSAIGPTLPGAVSFIAADDGAVGTGHLYSLGIDNVLRQSLKAGGMAFNTSPVKIASGQGLVAAPITMADPATVYWLDGGADTTCTTATGKLMRLTWGGAPVVVADNLTCPGNLAADKHHLYFSVGAPGSMQIFSVTR